MIGHPDLRVLDVVSVEETAQEDRAAATACAALDEITLDRFLPNRLEAPLQVVEANASHRRVREVGGSIVGVAEIAGSARRHEAADLVPHVAPGVAQLYRVRLPASLHAMGEGLDP